MSQNRSYKSIFFHSIFETFSHRKKSGGQADSCLPFNHCAQSYKMEQSIISIHNPRIDSIILISFSQKQSPIPLFQNRVNNSHNKGKHKQIGQIIRYRYLQQNNNRGSKIIYKQISQTNQQKPAHKKTCSLFNLLFFFSKFVEKIRLKFALFTYIFYVKIWYQNIRQNLCQNQTCQCVFKYVQPCKCSQSGSCLNQNHK
ncbi:hypothetical protein PPERSA_11463 [Pseudocohnilembus persalinus]|uniref:Uncharacterized protein n=1 Tax=Pseudocohnilembus persalinus TaxID=266149 RepID=A0A0V0QX50_PSEPJ|nr:hypothetical protein PPERSA_11463 [Pseudocohnilembus persalinus]|eukprot:KRX06818.1 hypothetical protein PPERSA_11463 [Pseudocohnilembus persalinus]